MAVFTFDQLARRAAIATITGYQRQISPRKGFACPHRLLYGGESCSDFAKRQLQHRQLGTALGAMPQRLRHCHRAALMMQRRSRRRGRFRCIVIPCCIPL